MTIRSTSLQFGPRRSPMATPSPLLELGVVPSSQAEPWRSGQLPQITQAVRRQRLVVASGCYALLTSLAVSGYFLPRFLEICRGLCGHIYPRCVVLRMLLVSELDSSLQTAASLPSSYRFCGPAGDSGQAPLLVRVQQVDRALYIARARPDVEPHGLQGRGAHQLGHNHDVDAGPDHSVPNGVPVVLTKNPTDMPLSCVDTGTRIAR